MTITINSVSLRGVHTDQKLNIKPIYSHPAIQNIKYKYEITTEYQSSPPNIVIYLSLPLPASLIKVLNSELSLLFFLIETDVNFVILLEK